RGLQLVRPPNIGAEGVGRFLSFVDIDSVDDRALGDVKLDNTGADARRRSGYETHLSLEKLHSELIVISLESQRAALIVWICAASETRTWSVQHRTSRQSPVPARPR